MPKDTNAAGNGDDNATATAKEIKVLTETLKTLDKNGHK